MREPQHPVLFHTLWIKGLGLIGLSVWFLTPKLKKKKLINKKYWGSGICKKKKKFLKTSRIRVMLVYNQNVSEDIVSLNIWTLTIKKKACLFDHGPQMEQLACRS